MSAQDEVSVVVKCLRLGAADYLVKPLRTNELLNLWTHVWRRRRMVCFTWLSCYVDIPFLPPVPPSPPFVNKYPHRAYATINKYWELIHMKQM